jgi:uncharacterized membrane protein YphA (DoxX/SURF4 family)
MRLRARNVPTRLATGGYILHAGLQKWQSQDDQHAANVHRMAAGAYPFLQDIPPKRFLKLLAAGEVATGLALLTPLVPNRVAGAALTAFAGGLTTMYLRSPTLHNEGSVWPTPAGIGISKDVWMLGIGLGLVIDDSRVVGS